MDLSHISPLAGHFLKYAWSDRGIRKAIKEGIIKVDSDFSDEQIQPGSLDFCVGKVRVYDEESWEAGIQELSAFSKQNFSKILSFEPTTKYAKVFESKKGQEIIIGSKNFAEIFIKEEIIPQKGLVLSADLRSSRGRLGLKICNELIEKNEEGFFVSLWNMNPNPIKIYSHLKFGQLFFHPSKPDINCGYAVTDPKESAKIAKKICMDEFSMLGSYLVFNTGDYIYRFKKNFGIIDTNKKYGDELYEKEDTEKGVWTNPVESVITQLSPRLKLSYNIGVKIMHTIPFLQGFNAEYSHANSVNAGWIDPGYEGNVTAHPNQWTKKRFIKKNDPIALGIIYKYLEPVERPYGSKGLNSHYQNSDGSTSRN